MPGTDFSTLTKLFQDTYSQVISDSLTRRGVADANEFIKPTSLLAWLREKGRVKIAGSAGDDFMGFHKAGMWKHQYASGQAGGSYKTGDAFLAAGDDSYEEAELDWKHNWEPVEVSGDAIDTGRGMSLTGDVDIWMRRFESGVRDLFDNIEDQLLLDGTGNTSADIDGMLAFLKQTGSYAGLSQAVNSWWRPFLSDAAAAALDLDRLRLVKYELNARKANYDAILTSEIQVDKYRDLKEDKVRYTTIQSGDIEREVPIFDGRPMIPVQGFPDGFMWFVNSMDLCFRILPPKMDPEYSTKSQSDYQGMPLTLRYVQPDRDADAVHVICRSNLICRNPFKSAYITNLAT